MAVVALQRGHCFRKSGATGTSGHRGTEQQFAAAVAESIAFWMRSAGHTVHVLTADEKVPSCDVFIALHQDGSLDRRATGASIGYPPNANNERYGKIWKALYQFSGYPFGFRADNYTSALRNYYGFKMTNASVEILVEHGFATNVDDCNWMWDNLDKIGKVHANTLQAYLGLSAVDTPKPIPTPPVVNERESSMFVAKITGIGGKAGAVHWYLVSPFRWSWIAQTHTLDFYVNQMKYPVYELPESNASQMFPADRRAADL